MKRQGAANSWVIRLIFINAVIFLLQMQFTGRLGYMEPPFNKFLFVNGTFGLNPLIMMTKGYVWQLVTYMFLHGNIMHILFNMYALLMFGVAIESVWGARQFLFYYFFTGIGAGVTIFVVNYFILGAPAAFITTIGASGAVFGILLAFGILFPDVEILLFFVIPVKAKYFVIGYGVLTISLLIQQNPYDPVSHAGHFGGLLFGIIYFVFMYRKNRIRSKTANFFQKAMKEQAQQVETRKQKQAETDETEVLISLVKKIKESGVESLTDDEIQKIKYIEIMYGDSTSSCAEDDFNFEDDYCLSCDSFEACIARELQKHIKFDK